MMCAARDTDFQSERYVMLGGRGMPKIRAGVMTLEPLTLELSI
jgi:hypothetical protein